MSTMLSSWKEIAQYFGKGVRTVQRWEKTLDLPIRRPAGAPSNVVLARTADLDAWMHRGLGDHSLEVIDHQEAATPHASREITTALNELEIALQQLLGTREIPMDAVAHPSVDIFERIHQIKEAVEDASSGSHRAHLKAA